MGLEILAALLAGLLSLASGSLLTSHFFEKYVKKFVYALFGREPPEPEPEHPYSEKLERLTTSLTKASKEMDTLLEELAQVANERHEAMQKVEKDLQSLQNREKELQDRIQQLQNVPLPVAEHFAKLTSSGEQRSARRDYMLFGAGVVVSTVIAIALRLLGLG